MAEKRKLLAEMEKCFKKIDEGVELFEETMTKMVEANSENQREKFQDDLKKEIKKLQRQRDQIKGWQSSSEIKDKDKLTQYRKIIEQRMEQFKDIERENKTKPHSKQGLCAEEKLDPKEKEKSDCIEWLQTCIRRLEAESDMTGAKIETTTAEPSKKRGKKDEPKKNDKDRVKKLEELRHHFDRIKFHISSLEQCMRLVNNETLECKDVSEQLKEQMEEYLEALEPDSEMNAEDYDPENIYDDLNLKSHTQQLGNVTQIGTLDGEKDSDQHSDESHSPSLSNNNKESSKEPDENKDALLSAAKQRHSSGDTVGFSRASALPGIRSTPVTPLKIGQELSSSAMMSVASPPPPPTPPTVAFSEIVTIGTSQLTRQSSLPKHPSTSSNANSKQTTPAPVERGQSVGAVSTMEQQQQLMLAKDSAINSSQTTVSAAGTMPSSYQTTDSPASAISSVPSSASPAATSTGQLSTSANSMTDQQSMQQRFTFSNGPVNAVNAAASSASQESNSQVPSLRDLSVSAGATSLTSPQAALARDFTGLVIKPSTNQQPQEAHIPPSLGASPLGKTQISVEHTKHQQMMEYALPKMPLQMDSEKPRSYLPKMSHPTPDYYPKQSPANADTIEYFLRLTPETLFFIFYYMEGTRAQLLAAKALKKLSWRFHTKYLMWFQRHEEPKQITDDFEMGTYVYFDYEKWSQRKKEQFTFEYRFLEDKELD